jgi:hypothetical protein
VQGPQGHCLQDAQRNLQRLPCQLHPIGLKATPDMLFRIRWSQRDLTASQRSHELSSTWILDERWARKQLVGPPWIAMISDGSEAAGAVFFSFFGRMIKPWLRVG